MPHLAEEARIMMGNLIPYLRHKYKDGVLDYFREEDKMDAKDDTWDDVHKRVICATDKHMDIEEQEDGIGLNEATKFLEAEKAARKKYSESKPTQSDPKEKLAQQKEAAEKVNAMVNKSGKAYYKDDDSLSTLGGTLGTKTAATSGMTDLPMLVDTNPVENSQNSSSLAH